MEINTRMKKYHHYLTLLSLFMLLGILKLQAAIQLPAIFSNHMVLQRNSELTFWGWGIPGETISIAPEWMKGEIIKTQVNNTCLLYTSDAADDLLCGNLGGSRIV